MIKSLIRGADISASTDIPSEDYRVDPEGPVADEDVGTVEISATELPLEELQAFLDHVDIVPSLNILVSSIMLIVNNYFKACYEAYIMYVQSVV